MPFKLVFTREATTQLEGLKTDPKKHKKALKTLAFLQANPKHPGLNVHKFDSVRGPGRVVVWEAYVENNTPAAYRVLFFYGPDRETITILAIVPHP
jgi:hypothetical protein